MTATHVNNHNRDVISNMPYFGVFNPIRHGRGLKTAPPCEKRKYFFGYNRL